MKAPPRLSNALWTAALGLIGAALAFPAAAVPSYLFVDLHPAGATSSIAFGASSGQQVGRASGPATGGFAHAMLWSGTAASAVDLNPAGYTESHGLAISGTQQGGFGGGPATGGPGQALLWTGTAASAVNLNPAGFTFSGISGVSGGQQVGNATGFGPGMGGVVRPFLWSGTAASAVDLTPAGFNIGQAFGTDGSQQVGGGGVAGSFNHAILWTGTAASAVDLNPAGFSFSQARGVGGGQQVGDGSGPATGGSAHALLWTGTAASVVDLNPAGFTTTIATGVAGGLQVGSGSGAATGGATHALLWDDTAASVLDLHGFVPAPFIASEAWGIDAMGWIVGAVYDSSGTSHAALWVVAAPEPSTLSLVLLALLGMIALYPVRAGCNNERMRTRAKTETAAITWMIAIGMMFVMVGTAQAGIILFQDNFNRADSPSLGAPWTEANEIPPSSFDAGFIEINSNALGFHYSKTSGSSITWQPHGFAPLGGTASAAIMTFTYSPHQDGRVFHEAGLMEAGSGFDQTFDGAGRPVLTPVRGVSVLLARTNTSFANSSIFVIVRDGVSAASASVPLVFQLDPGSVYAVSLTLGGGALTAEVSDGTTADSVSVVTPAGFALDQVFFSDIQGGSTSGPGEFVLRFDDLVVEAVVVPSTLFLFGVGLAGLLVRYLRSKPRTRPGPYSSTLGPVDRVRV